MDKIRDLERLKSIRGSLFLDVSDVLYLSVKYSKSTSTCQPTRFANDAFEVIAGIAGPDGVGSM